VTETNYAGTDDAISAYGSGLASALAPSHPDLVVLDSDGAHIPSRGRTVAHNSWRPSARRGHRSRPPLDLVIPVLNEERRIGRTISVLTEFISDEQLPVRLIVVDNGCVDTTTAVVDAVSRPGLPIDLISCAKRGKGAAVRAGVLHSTAPFVGYCDADLPVSSESLVWALDLLEAGWEGVVGSRRCCGAEYVVRQPMSRRIGSTLFRAAAGDLRGNVADTQCGFKFFRTSLARKLVSDARVDGFAFDVELLARAHRLRARLIEMPISWSDRDGSSLRAGSDGIRAFLDLRALRRSLRGWTPAEGSA
jgi:dolichyl-phosphate beta-glucosyltransferase